MVRLTTLGRLDLRRDDGSAVDTLLAAASGLDVRDQTAGLEVNDVLAKPYAAEALLRLLRRVLTEGRAQ